MSRGRIYEMKKLLIIALLLFTLFGCRSKEISDSLNLFSDGLLAVEIDERWGYVNSKGDVVIQPIYDEASAFDDKIAIVSIGDKMQLIDTKGKSLLPKSYDTLYKDVESKRFFYEIDEKWGLLDSKGKVLTDALFDRINPFSDGLSLVLVGEKYGYMDENGKIIVSLIYDDAYSFSEGYAAVMQEDRWGFIDTKGSVYISLTFLDVYPFDEFGNARVQSAQNNTWGLINSESKLLVLKELDSISGEGPIYIGKLKSDYMLYKADGTRFNTKVYKDAGNIDGYFANLEFEGNDMNFWFNEDGSVFKSAKYSESDYWYFNIDSKMIPYFTIYDDKFIDIYLEESTLRFEADEIIQMTDDDLFIIERNDKYGILNKNKVIVIEFLYDFIYKTDDNYYIYEIDNKYGILNSKHQAIVPATYSNINVNFNIQWLFF